MAPRLKEFYRQEVLPALMKEFGHRNGMEAPRLEKIVLNVGLGEALQNPKALDSAAADIAAITGQKPVINRAKRSIANFKVREGNPIGLMVTIRGDRMWELYDRQRRPAPHPRLPRRLQQGLRRPRQLQPRPAGAAYLP